VALSLYKTLGGKTGCHQLSEAFYTRVARDPILRPLFPGKTLTCAIHEFAAFLAQFLGGPSEDSQRRWWLSLQESHRRFKIGEKERTAWLANMAEAFNDVQLPPRIATDLLRFFEHSSAYVVNSPADEQPIPHAELSHRWAGQLRLDEAVAAIRAGNTSEAIRLMESCARSVQCGLLALMIRHASADFNDYVRARLAADPALTQERFAGRTLLHDAAAAGNLAIVELLLSLGTDPNTLDAGRHTPLYSVANECGAKGAGAVVTALVRAGAEVDAHDGVKNCTALHMAARRDHKEIAQALLECGADIEARDSLGETPLRRAVNCNKLEIASLLITRGADAHCIGSKGLTPLQAARSPGMKQLLHRHANP